MVDEINRIGARFNFSQDFVLKAGLMLADIASVGFKVQNFTHANMALLEAQWSGIRTALVRAVELAASFGFNGQSLRADSALLPIAYYLYRIKAPDNYVTHSKFAQDRETIRDWLIRSLLKASGIWGSALDTLLTALRDVLRAIEQPGFPASALRSVMAARGKTLTFEAEEIEDMVSMQYGDKRLFCLLSLLFPHVDLRNQFHVDHVFPISRFTPARLRKSGVAEADLEDWGRMANEMPNLQLLDGAANLEKRASLPAPWLKLAFQGNPTAEAAYLERNCLGIVPESLLEFGAFHSARRALLMNRLRELLVSGAGTG